MSFLEIREVDRRFATQVAVDHVSFTADAGEFISLLGPSGSGKTTLLRMVAGFELPDSGRIVVDDEDVTFMPPQKRNMGMVFQSYALFPNLTAADNVAFGLRTRKVRAAEIKERVAMLLDLVGLGQKGSRYPNQLSGGEQQRVALARALAPNPRVLLLDEPLSALDARIRINLRGEIRRIQQTMKITTLYVTHDQEEALSMSDRVVVLNRGHAEQIGTPQEIYDQPATLFVSSFVGTMNRLSAVIADRESLKCRIGDQTVTVESLPEEVKDGDSVQLWIRPEGLTLVKEEPDDACLAAHVEDVIFLGSRYGVRVAMEGTTLTLDVPRVADSPVYQPGASVWVKFGRPPSVTWSGPTNAGVKEA